MERKLNKSIIFVLIFILPAMIFSLVASSINPLGAMNQIEGGVIDGIGHSMYGDLTFQKGVPQATNFDKYRLIRMKEAPIVETHLMKNEFSPTGLGEPTLPPAGGAIANAFNAATGKRLYKQPFSKYPELLKGPEKEIIG